MNTGNKTTRNIIRQKNLIHRHFLRKVGQFLKMGSSHLAFLHEIVLIEIVAMAFLKKYAPIVSFLLIDKTLKSKK